MKVKAYILSLLKNEKVRNGILALTIAILVFLSSLAYVFYYTSSSCNALADKAESEYEYFEKTPLSRAGLNCQGQRYCNHFNANVVDWCCYFVGYCADTIGLDLGEIGFSPNTGVWIHNLHSLDKYQRSDRYTPRRGNLIFFDYSGRQHHYSTGYTDHIGIIVDVNEDKREITVIAGNESGTTASNSRINRYTLSLDDNNIACYGNVGSQSFATPTTLNTQCREIITHNEVGVLYSELSDEFGSVIPNDNGAISIGVYGWHGNNALSLLQDAYENSPIAIKRILNQYSCMESIGDAIIYDEDWSSYIPNSNEANCIEEILLSSAGKKAQDTLSLSNAERYITVCKEYGLTDEKTILYCCDILNQWGIYSFESGGCLSGLPKNATLDTVYSSKRAFSDSKYNYSNRRTWTYFYIRDL